VLEQGLNVRQTEERVRRLNSREEVRGESRAATGAETPEQRPVRDVHLEALEERLRHALGTKVQVFRSRSGGKLVIHFYDDEQLAGLVESIAGADL
jgi:ParB family chromosome partitioning protein